MDAKESDAAPKQTAVVVRFGLGFETGTAVTVESELPIESHPVVVSDTSPIRALGNLGLIDLLRRFFQVVLVPPAVAAELRDAPSKPTAVFVGDFPFIWVQAPSDVERVQQFGENLDPGESEALALALEVRADLVLIDEPPGRKMAQKLGLVPLGVLGLLVRAKQRSMIDKMTPLMKRLKEDHGFHINEKLWAEILRMAGESS